MNETPETVKLWHDDVRAAPDGWLLARTNEEAELILLHNLVDECSIDHDLGGDPAGGPNVKGSSPDGSGHDLVRWMIHNDLVPDKVTIHSANPVGAKRMAATLRDAGHDPIVAPALVA